MSPGLVQAVTCSSASIRIFPNSFSSRLPINLGRISLLKSQRSYPRVKAVSSPEECNAEECAPVKEVGRVSMEWVAEEKTKVTGTFPPTSRRQGPSWTGYVEKDTAGQTNIYSVEPTVYVAESGISSGAREDSTADSQNSLAVSFGLGLIFVAGATSILVQVGKNSSVLPQEIVYTGPALSYYIQKFNPPVVAEAASPIAPELTNSAVNTEALSLTEEQAPSSTIPAVDTGFQDTSLVQDVAVPASSISEIVSTEVQGVSQ